LSIQELIVEMRARQQFVVWWVTLLPALSVLVVVRVLHGTTGSGAGDAADRCADRAAYGRACNRAAGCAGQSAVTVCKGKGRQGRDCES
jgi:hypothetical protein